MPPLLSYVTFAAIVRAMWGDLWTAIEARETRIATDGLSDADADYMMRHYGETREDVGEVEA